MTTKTNTDVVFYKDEGEGGPVTVRRGGVTENYEDSDHVFLGRVQPKWFTRHQAHAIAKRLGLPFREA
jgi:hypothetical protein